MTSQKSHNFNEYTERENHFEDSQPNQSSLNREVGESSIEEESNHQFKQQQTSPPDSQQIQIHKKVQNDQLLIIKEAIINSGVNPKNKKFHCFFSDQEIKDKQKIIERHLMEKKMNKLDNWNQIKKIFQNTYCFKNGCIRMYYEDGSLLKNQRSTLTFTRLYQNYTNQFFTPKNGLIESLVKKNAELLKKKSAKSIQNQIVNSEELKLIGKDNNLKVQRIFETNDMYEKARTAISKLYKYIQHKLEVDEYSEINCSVEKIIAIRNFERSLYTFKEEFSKTVKENELKVLEEEVNDICSEFLKLQKKNPKKKVRKDVDDQNLSQYFDLDRGNYCGLNHSDHND